jgi:TIR domain
MIFISHSGSDLDTAKQIECGSRRMNIDSWLDASKIPVGEHFVEEIANALSQSPLFILIDTQQSRSSYWVGREVQTACRMRRHGALLKMIRLCEEELDPPVINFDCTYTSVKSLTEFLGANTGLSVNPFQGSENGNCVEFVIDSSHQDKTAVWLGFSDTLRLLDEWFAGAIPGCWISGQAASGKTSLAMVWLTACRLLGYGSDLRMTVRLYSFSRGFYQRPSPSKIISEISQQESRQPEDVTLVYLDELNEPSAFQLEELRELVAFARYSRNRLLVTSRSKPPTTVATDFKRLTMQPLSDRDQLLLLSKAGLADTEAQVAVRRAEGSPLYVALVVRELQSGRRPEDLI